MSVVSCSANREWTWPFSPDNDIPLPIRCLQENAVKKGKVGWEIGREGFPRFLFLRVRRSVIVWACHLTGQPFSWTFGISSTYSLVEASNADNLNSMFLTRTLWLAYIAAQAMLVQSCSGTRVRDDMLGDDHLDL